jgi:hypothetical protein
MGFEVGGRYRNRNGWYEVLAVQGGKLVVRYDDGCEARLDAAMQEKIMANMSQEERRVTPYRDGDSRQRSWARTIGVLAASARLEAEVPPQSVRGFASNYTDATGDHGILNHRHVYLLHDNVDKWGSELRIYLPRRYVDADFTLPDGVDVVSGFSPSESRVNNSGFWWDLVRDLGFRVGDVQDVSAIRSRMPHHLLEAFDEGVRAVAG